MKLHFGLSIFVLTTAILTTGSSRAATISVFANVSAIGNPDSVIQPFSVNQFNPSLGTLNSVTIFQSTSGSGTLAFENTSSTAVTAGYGLSGTSGLQDRITVSSLGVFLNFFPDSPGRAIPLSQYDGVTDYAGSSGRTLQSQQFSSSLVSSLVKTESIGLFQGNGQVTLFAQFFGNGYISSPIGFNGVYKYTTSMSASYAIAYDYTPIPNPIPNPIPEPSTVLGMSLSGAFGLAFYRKKRSKSLV